MPKKDDQTTSCFILNAATKLFSRKGMGGTTTREIAALADVNIAALHYHWGGKDDLLKAVYQKVMEEVGLLAVNLFSGTEKNLKASLEKYVGELHDFFTSNPDYPRIMLYGDLENPAFLEELRKQYAVPLLSHVTAELKRLMKEKKIRQLDPEATLFYLYGAMMLPFAQGSIQQTVLGDDMTHKKIAKRLREQFIQHVLITLGLQK